MIISFVNRKGGVGKTTAAINLASSLARRNNRILLIDADPQGSAAKWHGIEGNQAFEILHQPYPLNLSEIQILESSYNHLIVDAAPTIGDSTITILRASHFAVIPVSPSYLDLWSCKDILHTIDEVRQQNPELEVRFLINRKIPGTKVGREVRDALMEFKPLTLNSELCQRVAYIDAMKYGVSVMQFAPGSKAAEEVELLCDELVGAKSDNTYEDKSESNLIAEVYQQETDNILFRSFQGLL